MNAREQLRSLINRLVMVYGMSRVYAEVNSITGKMEGREERKIDHLKKHFANK
jgi:hypothetical protein